jgi:hypothetical protein
MNKDLVSFSKEIALFLEGFFYPIEYNTFVE